MPAATEEIKTAESLPEKLGIIAGGGGVPARIIEACKEQNISLFIVALKGQTDPALIGGQDHIWARLGGIHAALKELRKRNIKDLVLIGSVRRPSLSELRPDIKTATFLAKTGLKTLGDNHLLGLLRKMLEEEGFHIHGVHKFAGDLLAPPGVLGHYGPGKTDNEDIKRGVAVLKALGKVDVGQAAIVQEGIVLGVEAAEGTDRLIKRCAPLQRKGRKPVLVKMCKPGQDRDLDLPTIGPDTLRHAAKHGLGGLAVHAGASLLYEPEKLAALADRHKIFVIAINPEDYA